MLVQSLKDACQASCEDSGCARYLVGNDKINFLSLLCLILPAITTMAPSAIAVKPIQEPSAAKLAQSASESGSSSDHEFAMYRDLVPVAAEEGLTYLNASFSPPSNLIVAQAITKYVHESLYRAHPKPTWQADALRTKQLLSRYINAGDPSNIALTRDTTEGLGCIIGSLNLEPGDNVVILDTEHPNHAFGWMAMRSRGIEIRQVPTIPESLETGTVVAANADTFRPYVDKRTRVIGLSTVMFHSGQWNDVAGISREFRPCGIHVLADITQQVGFAIADVQAMGVSAAAFSLHKGLSCPTGLGGLYVDPTIIKELGKPSIVGAGAMETVRPDLLVTLEEVAYHQSAQRFDHLNLSLLNCAAANAFLTFYLDKMGPKRVEEHLYALGDLLRRECGRLGIGIVGPESRSEHAPHLYVMALLDPAWTEHLASEKIQVTLYRLGIRVSFGFYNNLADIQKLIEALEKGLAAGLQIR